MESTAAVSSKVGWAKWGFPLALAVVVLLAAALRLPGYAFSLPYVEPIDEPNFYLAGQEWRGLFDNGNYYDGYPPVYLALQAVAQPTLEAVGISGMAATVQAMRLLAIAAGLGTIVCLALTARLAAGSVAGLVAGAAWALAPLAVENDALALPDPLVYFFTALTLWLTAAALGYSQRRAWSVWALAAAITAVLLKYPVLPLVGVPLLAGLVIWRRDRQPRYLLLQCALALVVTLWFLLVYTASIQPQGSEYDNVSQGGLAGVLNVARVTHNIYQALVPLGPLTFALYAAAGALAWLVAPRWGRARVDVLTAALCLYLVVTIPWVAASYIEVDLIERARAVLPATAAACVLLGLAVGQVGALLPRRWPALAALPLIALTFIPWVSADLALMQNRLLPDRRVALRQWFDASLDPGTVLVYRDNHKTFNPIWGGIPHRRWVDWIETADITAQPAPVWRDQHGVSYAALPRAEVEALAATAAGRAYLDTLLPLRAFYAPPPARGPETAFFRLWRMEQPLDAAFSDRIRLVGCDGCAPADAAPGSALTFRFYWQALALPAANYSLFVHLAALDERTPLAQADGAPGPPDRPTLTWDAPGETLISAPVTLTLPPDLPPGTYRLLLGLYDYASGARLPLAGGGDAFELARLTVP